MKRLITLLFVVVLAGCAGPDKGSVILIGVDGLEWGVMLPLIREGRMPRVSRLMREGVFGELATLSPTKSPVIWTTMATGVNRDRHGIHGFVVDNGEGGRRPYSRLDRRTKAVWNILSEHDRRVAVVGWWLTYPVEEVTGVMVAQVNTMPGDGDGLRFKGALEEGLPGQVHPRAASDDVFAVVPRVERELDLLAAEIFGEPPPSLGRVTDRLWDHCRWAFRADEIYRRVARDVLARDPKLDFFTVYFGGADVVGHRYWRYMHPEPYREKPSHEEVLALRDVIPQYYAHVDRLIGEIVDAAPEGSDVLVVSDHGMGAVNTAARYHEDDDISRLRSGGHRTPLPGVLIAAGPRIARGGHADPGELERDDLTELGTVLDLTPTLLSLSNVPLARDMEGAVMLEVVDAEWLAAHPSRWVETHTPDDWWVSPAEIAAEALEDPERIEQLRALGYLGD